MFDPSTPDAFWLDITNAGLGVFCLVCLVALGWAVVRDLRDRHHAREVEEAQNSFHVLHLGELGVTMADGGRPVDEPSTETRKDPSPSRED